MEEGALVLNLVLLNLASFNKLMSQTDYTSIRITILIVHNLITAHDFGVPARFHNLHDCSYSYIARDFSIGCPQFFS